MDADREHDQHVMPPPGGERVDWRDPVPGCGVIAAQAVVDGGGMPIALT